MDILSNLKYAPGSVRKERESVEVLDQVMERHRPGAIKAGSRSGNKWHAWFEGGQMPLQRRLPKFGFNNPSRIEFQVLNLGKLQSFIDKGKLKGQI
jgi:large subunit ribosomal protein L15